MRLVIDKDFNQRTLLQESYDKKMPTYKVRAVNAEDKFIYATNLKRINEAVDATYDLAWDATFDGCQGEIVEIVNGKERVIWSSDEKVIVSESVFTEEGEEGEGGGGEEKKGGLKGFFSGLADKAKKGLESLKKGWDSVTALTKNFSKDMLSKWRDAHYFTKDGKISGLGYKVMTGKAKNTVDAGAEEQEDKKNNIAQVWEVAKSDAIQALKKTGAFKEIKDVVGVAKNDKDAIQLAVKAVNADGDEQSLMMTQDGEFVNGNNAPGADASGGDSGSDGGSGGGAGGEGGDGGSGGGSGGSGGGGDVSVNQIADLLKSGSKNGKNLVERVDAIEEKIGIKESSWIYNGQTMTKEGLERSAISTFFKQLNESDVKEIVFIEGKNKKVYDINNGSASYSQFKKDVRESTGNAHKMFKESKETTKTYKMVVEFSKKSKLSGYKMSDFGGVDTPERVVTFRVVKENTSPKPTKKVVKEDECVVTEATETKEVVNESLVLEMDVVNPEDQIKALVASMNKFTSGKPETSPLTKPTAPISTPVSTFGMPEQEIVTEEGEEEADPFAGGDDGGGDDAGGDDAGGGDDGGDPFGGGDDAGGDEGGDDAGGDDPFGGDAGDEGGDDAGAEGGDDAAAEDPDDPTGEPAADAAINTDAQGNPKSQYNINVTKAFNVDDSFELNEEEQQEFFGKIDQLVKIPDMENYALYLYQITPENVNLDDVHYITALYELSVKLGLLEDVYADSNLLEKYSSYKYSVVKNGEEGENGQDEMTIQEGRKYAIMEGTDKPKVQKDNEEKTEKSKKVGSSKDDDERRGPKDMKLDKDENGADKPVIIDANEYGWENKDKKLTNSTEMDDFRGLGWVVTFKAMQFGSPRYMTMYIKKNGDEKAETQCKKYLEKLSYTEIDIVKIEEIDPYEYVYRNGAAGMKSVEEVHGAAVVNKDIPYLESTKEEAEQPSIVKEGAMAKLIPEDVKRDVKGVLTKLNSEIRNTKQFNFANECGVYKPQLDHVEFMNCYRTAKVDETVGDTTYKFILKKNDSMMSRMFYSNLQEKLFKYLGTFATKYNMECNCQACPTYIMIDFVRSDLNNPMGYDLDTMVDKEEALPEAPAI